MDIRHKTAAFHTLGCKVNTYETEAMQQQLIRGGYTIVPFEPGADVYVINTCSVTNIADRKSRQMLSRAKKMNPDAVIVAAGCYVQTAAEKTGLAVDADIILGNHHKKDLLNVLEEYFAQREPARIQLADEIGRIREYEQMRIDRTTEHCRAFLKVQDGCNQFCTYCIIPYARGRARSRNMEEVLSEIRDLTKEGIREFVLNGIHLSSYGIDRNDGSSLLTLIQNCAEIPGVERIRLGSLEPNIVSEEFAKELAQVPQICPHFHLSLQSGCDTVLKRMNRHYTSSQYLERCDILRSHFQDPALTTDVITGFPGETAEEFEISRAFLETVGFYEVHVFRYSPRKGTIAAGMKDQVPEHVKEERSAVLIAESAARRIAFEKRRDKKNVEVLVEEKKTIGGTEYYTGHSREYIACALKADEFSSDPAGTCVQGILNASEGPQGFALVQVSTQGIRSE